MKDNDNDDECYSFLLHGKKYILQGIGWSEKDGGIRIYHAEIICNEHGIHKKTTISKEDYLRLFEKCPEKL